MCRNNQHPGLQSSWKTLAMRGSRANFPPEHRMEIDAKSCKYHAGPSKCENLAISRQAALYMSFVTYYRSAEGLPLSVGHDAVHPKTLNNISPGRRRTPLQLDQRVRNYKLQRIYSCLIAIWIVKLMTIQGDWRFPFKEHL